MGSDVVSEIDRAAATSEERRSGGTEPRKASVTCQFSEGTALPRDKRSASAAALASASREDSSGMRAKNKRGIGQSQRELQCVLHGQATNRLPIPTEKLSLRHDRGP